MKFYGDYHNHTRHSDGRQDIEEIAEAAVDRGLREVAVTDHGPLAAVIGVKDEDEYLKIRERIDELNAAGDYDVEILLGAEANIRDLDGTLDISPEVIAEMDILIAGMHPYTLPTSVQDGWGIFVQNSLRHLGKGQQEKAINANTKACVAAIYNNPELDILSHPGLYFTINVREVAKACVKNEVLFEINCAHKYPDISAIMEADKVGVDFIINSDAHFQETVGNLDYGSRVVDELEIEPQRVVNWEFGGGYSGWCKKRKTYTYS